MILYRGWIITARTSTLPAVDSLMPSSARLSFHFLLFGWGGVVMWGINCLFVVCSGNLYIQNKSDLFPLCWSLCLNKCKSHEICLSLMWNEPLCGYDYETLNYSFGPWSLKWYALCCEFKSKHGISCNTALTTVILLFCETASSNCVSWHLKFEFNSTILPHLQKMMLLLQQLILTFICNLIKLGKANIFLQKCAVFYRQY